MMKKLLIFVFAAMMCGSMVAQIPAEVKNVLKQCEAKMDNPAGLEIDMKIHLKALVFSINGTIKTYSKGEKDYTKMTMSAMGENMDSESGFDGVNEWEYKPGAKTKKKVTPDSLIIKKADKKSKGEYSIELDMDKEYNKATMKEKDGLYVITFTDPKKKDKETPKKTVLKISKNTMMFHSMEAKISIASMRITATHYKIGVSDDIFKLDPKRYPNAVVVRK
jgi:outer membrane lipoprotein-sorting protein